MSLILFLIILGVLVVSHEFGHFIVAKLSGMRVDEFGFGFPPRLFSFKKGETTYSINLIPFGGFVKIWGEDAPENAAELSDADRSFVGKPKSIQAAVVVAGVVFNLLLAWALLSLGLMVGMPTSTDQTSLGPVTNPRVVITEVLEGTPADLAGLEPGDEIVVLDAEADSISFPQTAQEVQAFIFDHANIPLNLTYKRGASDLQKIIVRTKDDVTEGRPVIGIALDTLGVVQLSPISAIIHGGRLTLELTRATVMGFLGLVRDLFVNQAALDSVTGPVGLVGLIGSSAAFGLVYLLGLTAVISVNLAVMNLIPFPALDGGRLLFILIEKIKGTPITPRIANTLNAAGFFALIGLMAFITWKDVAKLITG